MCSVYTTELRVYGSELSNLQKFFTSFTDDIEKFLIKEYGVTSFRFLIGEFPDKKPDDDKDADKDADEDADEDSDKGGGVSAVVGGETRSISNKEGISAGGFIGFAGAGLILLLLLLLFVRRGKNKNKNAARHLEYTDEDENSGFVDEEDDADSYSDFPTSRLAHVVGEEDSQYTGESWGGNPRIRIEPVQSIPEDSFSNPIELSPNGVPYEEVRRHDIGQTCSSPTCKICDARRQQGATTKFVRNQKYDPSPGEGTFDRDYISSDTVDL